MSRQTTKSGVPVTKRAILQRINRAMAPDFQGVRAVRGDRWRQELGDYYALDFSRNFIIEKHVDLEELGRRLGVLKAWERVAE